MMKSLLSWFNDRTGLGDWCGRLADSPTPGGACWCRVLPCVVAFLFCVQAITGFFLWAYYSPSAQTAWESVYYIQNEVTGGWLLRAIHHYAAYVLLAVLILAVVQSILARAYRAPRELVFWATVGLGLFALAAVLTGDLLSWDQNGYAATKTRTGFLTFLPWVGDSLLKIAIGGPGPALGSLSLTRFFAMHVGLFGGGFLLLLIIRSALARRANVKIVTSWDGSCTAVPAAVEGTGVQLPSQHKSQYEPRREGSCTAVPYWPAQAWRGAVACLLALAVVLALSCQDGVKPPHAGAPLLSPADTNPLNAYDAARPEWFLVGVYEFSHLFPGQWGIVPIFIVPGLLVLIVLAMPFLGKHWIGHGFNVLFTLFLLAGVAWLTHHSYAKDRNDPAHQKAIAAELWRADRVCELIRHNQGIPPGGALSLLQHDPKAEGPRFFAQQCASCHNHVVPGDKREDLVQNFSSEKPTAPNLASFASRRWLAGLLDPKRISGPDYFGGTKLHGGDMPGFVKETFGDADAEQKKNIAKVVAAVSAEAHLPSQKTLDARDAKTIEEGRKLIVGDFGCTNCHKFHKSGSSGSAPELTGYGSPEWIAGILRNPANRRFYGKLNDRMPAYAAANDPAQNTLTPEQIKLLADWLRGEWYEERNDE
ncbi:MAG: cytochrome b N-terminal domain-containing protein [Thermoguttaceae bacterium]|jgi:ubiquinol-cytochrome c reductase cytochrome b subunit